MISRVHRKLGTAGFIISIIALVAALGGGAYAASGGLTGKQKKEVEKIAKKYAGKPGAPGAPGASGASGVAGTAGTPGAKGDAGTPGTAGEQGPEGEEGSPWTAGGVLPKGATETGVWSASGLERAEELFVPISFTIPLKSVLVGSAVHLVPSTGEGVCNGTDVQPKAPEGVLCVYKTAFEGVTATPGFTIVGLGGAAQGASRTGAFVFLEGVTGSSQAYGSWAVTGN